MIYSAEIIVIIKQNLKSFNLKLVSTFFLESLDLNEDFPTRVFSPMNFIRHGDTEKNHKFIIY